MFIKLVALRPSKQQKVEKCCRSTSSLSILLIIDLDAMIWNALKQGFLGYPTRVKKKLVKHLSLWRECFMGNGNPLRQDTIVDDAAEQHARSNKSHSYITRGLNNE